MGSALFDISSEHRSEAPDSGASRDRFGALDVLLAIAKNYRMIIGGALIAAILGWVFAHLSSVETYTSRSLLRLDESGARTAEAIIRSPAVVSAVVKAILPSDATKSDVIAREREIIGNFSLSPAAGTGRRNALIFALDVTDSHAERAQALNEAIIEHWLAVTRPRGDHRRRIEKRIAWLKAQVDLIEPVLVKLSKVVSRQAGVEAALRTMQSQTSTPRQEEQPSKTSDGADSLDTLTSGDNKPHEEFVDLLNSYIKLSNDIETDQLSLLGTRYDEVVATPPSFPSRENLDVKKAMISGLSMLSVGVLLALYFILQRSLLYLSVSNKTKLKEFTESFGKAQ